MTGPEPVTRLLCFPFAGGSAASYRMWSRLAAPGVSVEPIEYPGHGRRMATEPLRDLSLLVKVLAAELEPWPSVPFALFGHSMGGIVAYELTKQLRDRGAAAPAHLFVSGTGAPGAPTGLRSLATVSDREVIGELRRLGGTPPELFDDAELLAQAVRVLRADSMALGGYRDCDDEPLPVPITALGGREDELVPATSLRQWSARTSGGFRLRMYPGGHFFLYQAAGEILAAITRVLRGDSDG